MQHHYVLQSSHLCGLITGHECCMPLSQSLTQCIAVTPEEPSQACQRLIHTRSQNSYRVAAWKDRSQHVCWRPLGRDVGIQYILSLVCLCAQPISLDGVTFSLLTPWVHICVLTRGHMACQYSRILIRLWTYEGNWSATCESWKGPSSSHERQAVCQEELLEVCQKFPDFTF